jgi:hypothetical protein
MNGVSYRNMKDLERLADLLGFRLGTSNYAYENLCLMPKDDCLPIYSRDAEFGYNGTVEGCMAFLYGWEKSLMYTSSLKLTNDDKIQKKEDLYRQTRTLKTLRGDIDE